MYKYISFIIEQTKVYFADTTGRRDILIILRRDGSNSWYGFKYWRKQAILESLYGTYLALSRKKTLSDLFGENRARNRCSFRSTIFDGDLYANLNDLADLTHFELVYILQDHREKSKLSQDSRE